jgi:hypothetical protein
MSEMLFYRKIIALDTEKHRQLRIGEIKRYEFTRQTNSVPLTAVEFFEAAREFPIVFTKADNGETLPAALLGLRDKENLFIDSNGRWSARYIPAFVRRYPFLPAQGDASQLLVCIDEAHPAVGTADGQKLFNQDGSQTPFLDKAVEFMRDYQAEAIRTGEFVAKLKELDLFTEVSARSELRSGGTSQLNGLLVIDETKYRAIGDEVIVAFFRKGWLSFIDAHLLSLGNLGRLIDRLAATRKS